MTNSFQNKVSMKDMESRALAKDLQLRFKPLSSAKKHKNVCATSKRHGITCRNCKKMLEFSLVSNCLRNTLMKKLSYSQQTNKRHLPFLTLNNS